MVKNIIAGLIGGVMVLAVFHSMGSNKNTTPSLSGRVNTIKEVFEAGLEVSNRGTATLTGTTTIDKSPDGFVLMDNFTVATTSPVRAKVTNTTGSSLVCDGESLFVYTDAGTLFSPSFKVAVGTTTATLGTMPSSVGYSANLLASTTIATTTDTAIPGVNWPFILANNDSITLSVGDYAAPIASSTYYSRWANNWFGVHCWVLGE